MADPKAASATDIPQLDPKTANQLLNNVFAACDMEPSTIPVEVLESWGNYKKPKTGYLRNILLVVLALIVFLPVLFLTPNIVAKRTHVDSVTNAVYEVQIHGILPVSSVSATLDGVPVSVQKSGNREYLVTVTQNGELQIKATSVNGQYSIRNYTVSHIDSDKPEFVSFDTKDGKVLLTVRDTFSGIDYEKISGLTPLEVDEEKGVITFKIPDQATSVTIPDKAGNELVLLLSPVMK